MIQAERVLLKTDDQGYLIDVPKLPPNINIEVIFLLLGQRPTVQVRRQPPPRLKGTVTMSDDLLEPAFTDEEWEESLDRTACQIAGKPQAFR